MGQSCSPVELKANAGTLPNARVMLHQPMGGITGQASDMEIHAQEIIKMREQINAILVDCTGQPLERIARDTERDFFMTADEAADFGVIDEIISAINVTSTARS